MGLFDTTKIPLLNKALDVYSLRQKVSSANMANVTTPGYKSQSVSFEEQLASAAQQTLIRVQTTHEKHFPLGAAPDVESVQPDVHDTSRDNLPGYNAMASGFNDVDVDSEMSQLAKNQIQFKFSARLLSDTFKNIEKAIRGTQ